MSIVSINPFQPGLIGVLPAIVQMTVTDNLATVTTAGYLNKQGQVLEGYGLTPASVIEMLYSYNPQTNSGTFGIFTVAISAGVITLSQWANPGDVLLPVTSGDFAVFNGTTGQIKDAGFLPSNAAKTNVVMANGASIVNHIATYTDTAGTIGEDAATAINGGNIQAGLSGTAGELISFPAGALAGSLIIKAIGNTGDTNITIQNAIYGQATTLTIADPGAAAANLLVAESGTNLVKSVAQAAVAGGAAAQTVTDAFCTTGSCVIASWNDTTNPVDIQTVAAGNGSFIVTSSADPGASHLNYVIFK